jgi:formiminotetrahydrofolate cyclodeaminase
MSEPAAAESVLANSIGDFAELVAAGTPSPGGGSVAAYCGVLAAALGQMVCSLSIGKKKYAAAEPRLLNVRAELEELGTGLKELIEEDAASFEDVLRAYRLPKETDEQSGARTEAIQLALQHAVAVPLETASRSMEVLRLLREIAEIGNTNALSDVAVGAQLAKTAIICASYNVAVNLGSISDKEFVSTRRQQMDELTEKSNAFADEVQRKIQTENS